MPCCTRCSASTRPSGSTSGRRLRSRSRACFILAVDDKMDSILDWYKEEGMIFKGGSGSGVNLSRIRSSKELLSSGGTASGPVSFMRGADASAGTIKSGGATRRAAKMVILDVDHPDIEEFIETKAREEDKIRVLRDAGYDMDLGGRDMSSVQYQNANNSVRVNEEFMRAYEKGSDVRAQGTHRRLGHRDRRRQGADAQDRPSGLGVRRPRHPVRRHHQRLAHDSGDRPHHGVQPVLPGRPAGRHRQGPDPASATWCRARQLARRSPSTRTTSPLSTTRRRAWSPPARRATWSPAPTRFSSCASPMARGFVARPGHRLWTSNRGWVHAEELQADDHVVRSFHEAIRPMASLQLPDAAVKVAQRAVAR